jgi:hypothetical protein
VGDVKEQQASGIFAQPMEKCGFTQLQEVHLEIRGNRFDSERDTQMALKNANVMHVILKQVFSIERRKDIIQRQARPVPTLIERGMNPLEMFSSPGGLMLLHQGTRAIQLMDGKGLA